LTKLISAVQSPCQHHKQRVTVEYSDDPEAMAAVEFDRPSLTMYEEIDVQVENDVEVIEVPQFDECRRSLVMHDFFNVSLLL